MKFIYAILLAFISTTNARAATPFDAFAGEYSVTNRQCQNLVTNTPILPNDIEKITLFAFSEGKKFRYVAEGPGVRADETMDEDLGARFSGDGIVNAKWAYLLEREGFLYSVERSLIKTSAQLNFVLEYKYFDERQGVPASKIHTRCEFTLAR